MAQLERIGRYRVLGWLGAGGFASVWLAEDEILQAQVAIKVLADNWLKQLDVRDRFVEEARILRKADSDRVVRVFDIGELADERPYFVMAYADGGTLADRLTGGRLAVPEALHIAVEVAKAVAVLHRIGVIHRDITPSNVLFQNGHGGAERILVADLGLAKAVAHASGISLRAGTPGYMAPEQAIPGGGIDVRADVFGLGALTYRMLTGTTHDAADDIPPSGLRAGVGPEVDAVVLRALDGDRDQRWPNAQSFAAALEAANSAQAVAVPSDSTSDETEESDAAETDVIIEPATERSPVRRRPHTRRRLMLVLAFGLVAALGAGAALTWYGLTAAEQVRISDATGAISLSVPTNWAQHKRDSGWRPTMADLTDGPQPALEASVDLATWRRLDRDTPGVFVGFTRDTEGALPPAETSPMHMGCVETAHSEGTYRSMRAEVQKRTRCSGPWTLVEVGLTGDGFQVYVQVKQPTDEDRSGAILESLVINPDRVKTAES